MEASNRRWDWLAGASAGTLGLITALLNWTALDDLLPAGLLVQARRNNEALIFAALIILVVPVAKRAHARPSRWWWLFLGVGFLVTEVLGRPLGMAQSVITLNEAMLGAGLLTAHLYFSPERNAGRRGFALYVGLIALILLGELPIPGLYDSGLALWIVNHAEAWGFALLGAVYFDWIRPWPSGVSRVGARIAWYATLVVVPVTLSALNQHGVDSVAAAGPVESTLVWVQRITEAFIAAMVIAVYYDVRARLRSDRSSHARRHLATAALVVLSMGLGAVGAVAATGGFSDVPPGYVHAGAIEWLADTGVTKGCNPPANDRFCPEDAVTRAQMATFLQRFAANYRLDEPTAAGAGTDGTDGAKGADGADGASAYEVAVAAGFEGTVSQWLQSLQGPPGQDASAAFSRVNDDDFKYLAAIDGVPQSTPPVLCPAHSIAITGGADPVTIVNGDGIVSGELHFEDGVPVGWVVTFTRAGGPPTADAFVTPWVACADEAAFEVVSP